MPALTARGFVHALRGEVDEANADYAKALWINPKSTRAYMGRGMMFAMKGYPQQACVDLDASIAVDPKNVYAPIYRWAAGTRAGMSPEETNKLLRTALEQRSGAGPADWLSKLAKFLLGELDEAALLSEADAPDGRTTRGETTRGRLCEAWYYAGLVH